MNAADTAAALAERAEAACARYLPNGRKQGRYWTVGDVHGGKGRSLFVRLGPPGIPGKWTDAATGEHGDLLDLIRIATGAASLREALAEAHRFLAQPVPPTASHRDRYDRAEAARNLWRRCRPIEATHAERLPLRPRHPDPAGPRHCDSIRRWPTATTRAAGAGSRRWSRPSPTTRGTSTACSAPGSTRTVRLWRTSSARARRSATSTAAPCVFSSPSQTACSTLLVGEGIETVLSLVTALPDTIAAAALSAGSLGAFVPPPGVSRLLIAQDRDAEGQRAALRLQLRCPRLGIGSAVIVPERNDFNDDLRALGTEHLAQRLAPLAVPHRASIRTAAPMKKE